MSIFLPRFLLRGEGAVLLVGSLALYHDRGFAWLTLILLVLLPDISMLGYLAGPRVGAAAYNIAHTLILPFGLALVCYFVGNEWLLSGALIWTAHIGLDRMVGYGLKEPSGFGATHLGRVGRDRASLGPNPSS